MPCIGLALSSAYAWACAVLRLVVVETSTSCPNHYEEAPMTCAVLRLVVWTQVRHAPGHYEEAPMTATDLQPLLPHPATAAHPGDNL